jgi:CHAD domain-containing protein
MPRHDSSRSVVGAADPPHPIGTMPFVSVRPRLPRDVEPVMTAHGRDGAIEAAPPPPERPARVRALTSVPQRPSAHAGDGTTLDLRADDPWAEAGRQALRFHLARTLARVPSVIADEDPEAVHAMRVSARRMRAAWRVFGDGFEREAVRHYRAEIREIGARLGRVRDLDVLIQLVEGHGARRGVRQRAGLASLVAAWRAEREAQGDDLVHLLGSSRFRAFADDYEMLVATPGHAARPVAPHSPALVRTRMPARLWTAYQDVWAFDGAVATADLATLHELRIAAKWLRYTLEFVRGPLDPEATALIRPVVALQDHLGDQHDQHVAAQRAREWAGSTIMADREVRSVGKLVTALEAGVERLGASLDAAWQPLVAPGYRRRLGRAIARL